VVLERRRPPLGPRRESRSFPCVAAKGIAKGKTKGAIDAGIDKLQELLEPDGKEEAESASA
jgi:hypothetical protein